LKNYIREKQNELAGSIESLNFKEDMKRIYKSKISSIPTPGYTGFQSTFTKPISYLNKDRILSEMEETENREKLRILNQDNETISGYFSKEKEKIQMENDEVIKIK
jgi:hypothetical protein